MKINRIANAGLFGVFAFTAAAVGIGGFFAAALFGENGTEQHTVIEAILRYLALAFAAFAVFGIFLLCRKLLRSERTVKLDDRRLNTTVIFAAVGMILLLQLSCAYLFRMHPITDIESLERYALHIARGNSVSCIGDDHFSFYVMRYQNNLNYLLILSAVYRIEYLLTGGLSGVCIITLNTVAINLTILMIVLTSRRLFGQRQAIFTLILCAGFAPYYTYTAYYYTDSLSLPFTAGFIYTLVCAFQSDSRRKKLCLLLLCGVIWGLGFEIKGSLIILLPALLIYLPIRYGWKRAVKNGAVLLLGFALVFGSVKLAVSSAKLISPEMDDRYGFPPTHWVMVGLKGIGAYTPEDSAYTGSFPTKQAKVEANLTEIGDRIAEKGFGGMAVHLLRKGVWTWGDGTYYIANYLDHYRERCFLHDWVLYSGDLRFPFYAYSCGYQLFLLTMTAYSAFAALRKRRLDVCLLMRIALFGVMLFFLIWEANPRYPFNFTPFLLLLATDGAVESMKAEKAA